jgi:glycine cleavage system H protein
MARPRIPISGKFPLPFPPFILQKSTHMSATQIPADLLFQSSHEWARVEGDTATVGISDHAQSELTDVVYVELPQLGKTVDAGDPTAVVESVKAASDIYAPVSGEVIEVNPAVEADPSLVNTDPYGAGWIFKLKVTKPDQLPSLLTPQAYGELIG